MFDKMVISSHRNGYTVEFRNLTTELIQSLTENSFLLIDSNVNNFYPHFRKMFENDKIIIIESTEKNKSLPYCQKLMAKLIERGIKKNHRLIAVGGGIIQDITGFIASILYRGVEWTFLPTTLLAQADSCIGSKTSINFGGLKNLIGTFYPPANIYCCPEFRNTLSKKDIKSGIGEILHYYLIDNNGSVNELVEFYDDMFKDRKKLTKHIYESLAIKRRMIIKDEFDQNERKIFNYGHTFGHAIETISMHKVPHGQAITLGMDIANFVALKFGHINQETYDNMHNLLIKNIPDYKIEEKDIDLYMKILSKDKKNIDNSIVCILPYSIGDMRVERVDDKRKIKKAIQQYVELHK